MFFAKTYAAACGLATLSSAHMIMSSPKPFAGVTQPPLLTDGSNFPCQMPDYSTTSATSMAKGSSQELAFIGQAVHGGGSCQISITYDTSPTKDSVWKVIHSIQGGCPAKNQAGNMGSDASAVDPYTYSFTIPDDIPTGKATLAWTWLNRIGNREYYMNCAPIDITGSSGEESSYEALPDMVVANIAALTECSTEGLDNFDYAYPNPGNSVDNFNMTVLKPLPDSCGQKIAASGSNSSAATSAAAAAPSSSSAAAAAPSSSSSAAAAPSSSSSAAYAPSATLPGAVFITVKTSAAASSAAAAQSTVEASSPAATEAAATTTAVAATSATQVQATSAPVVESSPTSAAPVAASTTVAGSASGSPSDATVSGSACPTEGMWNCVEGSSFQRCASGTWSSVMALASGVSCTPGQSTVLDMKAINGKMRHRLTRFRA